MNSIEQRTTVPGRMSSTNKSKRIVYSEIIDFKLLKATKCPHVIALIIMNDVQFRYGKGCSLVTSVCWKLNLFAVRCLKIQLMIQDEVKRMFSKYISRQKK
jgi:hypothetical protein